MSNKTWREKSEEWLHGQIKSNPDLEPKELRKLCTKNYPFSERSGHAYKAWLSVMREYFGNALNDKEQPNLFWSC